MAEADLIARAREGDAQAWTQIYEEYHDRIFRYVYFKLEDREEAEDLSAQVFLKAMESVASFRWRGVPFSAWLFRIAANLITDLHRKRASQQRYIQREVRSISTNSPDEIAEANLEQEEVRRAVSQLTPPQQEVIQLRFAAGLSSAETAQALKKSPAAVMALQHSALVALRKILGSYD